jgi:tripartite-type tricarboxylate transporter receptor subunit TctC
MKIQRRRFLQLAAYAASVPAVVRSASAQAYPSRPVRILVGASAGGPVDIGARLIGQWLSERLGQQFVVEDRPGAGGNLAAEAVVRALPDGYTLLMANGNNAVNATLFSKLNFDFIRDTTPVASLYRLPLVLEVHPSFPAKTVPELIAYAKANPRTINIATAAIGTAPYMAAELFKVMAGLDIVHVPYQGGGPMLTDVLGGHVPVAFDGTSSSVAHIRAGRLRALAVTTTARSQALPDIPTMAEFLPGYEASGFQGISAPRNTPVEIVDKLNKETNAGLADPNMRARIGDLGGMVVAGSPADFGKFIESETKKWGNVIQSANIKLE